MRCSPCCLAFLFLTSFLVVGCGGNTNEDTIKEYINVIKEAREAAERGDKPRLKELEAKMKEIEAKVGAMDQNSEETKALRKKYLKDIKENLIKYNEALTKRLNDGFPTDEKQ